MKFVIVALDCTFYSTYEQMSWSSFVFLRKNHDGYKTPRTLFGLKFGIVLFLGLAHCNLVGGSILRLVNLSYLPLIVY
jgi:hypothetical protein